ncbi:glycosyltransferase family 4 protein [Vibrio breoganii]|uniref:glycosyltransferase family 4 protein n=1 Tax=Vibrio breoganii TaxID=553239 RepID=UPI0010BD7577|nr:glycosyltransferase family 4 protein [Vibrio breoganii]TKG24507.1 glycosyltransferase family 4 protein [Vibrio breoganii]
MKYISLIPNLDNRSPNKVASNITNYLNKNKFDCEVYYVGKKENVELFDNIEEVKFNLLSIIKTLKPDDVIHSHGLLPDIINYIFKKFGIVKVSISTVHSLIKCDLKESKGVLWKLYFYLWIKSMKNKDLIFVLSSEAKRFYIKELGKNFNGRVIKISNGFDLPKKLDAVEEDYITLVDELKKNNSILIGTACVLREMKGIQHVIKSLVYNDKLKFIIFGDGPYKSELETLVNSLELNDRVIFFGFVDKPISYLTYLDVYTLTSDFEGFPLSLLEAVSLKIPCVCTDNKYFREYFPAECLNFANVHNARKLSKVLSCANNENQSEEAYKYYLEHYTNSKVGSQYRDKIEALLRE